MKVLKKVPRATFEDMVMGKWDSDIDPAKPIPHCYHKPPHMKPEEEETCWQMRKQEKSVDSFKWEREPDRKELPGSGESRC